MDLRLMQFEGVPVIESRMMPRGTGLTLPGIGIFVYKGAWSRDQNLRLLQHEFGHILQARKTGILKFYLLIGIPSLWSAIRSKWSRHQHHLHPVEVEADQLADAYFNTKR